MLRHIHIKNFAIVEQLDLELSKGMTVFTGETGAGKSILVEALGLVLGNRAQSTMVRAGCGQAFVTAAFDVTAIPQLLQLLRQKGLDTGNGECVIWRRVNSDGRSHAFVNGISVPGQILREIGELLIDIHSQHAHQSLLRRDIQRELLDEFARHPDLLEAVAQAYRKWKEVTEELAVMATGAAHDRDAEMDLLKYQIQEMETFRLSQEELATLEQEYARLSNLTRIMEGCQRAFNLLHDDKEGAGILVSRARREIQNVQEFDAKLIPITGLLDNAALHIDETGKMLRRYLESLESDPKRLRQIETRISALHDLARKHRIRIGDLPGQLEALKARLKSLENSEQRFRELQAMQLVSLEAYHKAARPLHESRTRAALEMARRITANMYELGMPNGGFSISVKRIESELPAPMGTDHVEFLVTTNPGQPLWPLSKVASGGELSRISLAIQVITAGDKGVPTLIFDEVDVGIGGAVAEIVGQHLRCLAKRRQVFCVTHLPQVASLSHHHLQVIKTTHHHSTYTSIYPLKGPERVKEIARMLGGRHISPHTLNHAKEMLEQGTEN